MTSAGEHIWKTETGTYGTSPTVVDGTVYVGGTGLWALDAAGGSKQWQAAIGVEAAPAVVDGIAYAGSSSGTVYAMNADDGSKRWDFDVGTGSFYDSPTVAGGTVHVTSNGTLFGLDANDGTRRWSFQTADNTFSSPTVIDDTAYVGSSANAVYAVAAHNGSKRWEFQTSGAVGSSPTVVGETVYVGCDDYTVYALDATDGSKRWAFQTGNRVASSPTVYNGTVYVGSSDGYLYALDAASGSKAWKSDGFYSDIYSSPTVAGGTVFVGTRDANLIALDAADGSKQWEFTDGTDVFHKVSTSPVVVNGVLYVTASNGYTYAVDAGVTGSSEGSRVALGTLGHHHVWAQDASAPISAGITRSTGTVNPGDTITFDASESDGIVETYDWDFGDGTTARGTQPSHSYDSTGTYTVTLTVSGPSGSDTASTEALVTAVGALGFSYQPTAPRQYESITFEATGGDNSYSWDFGDGTTATGNRVVHTFDQATSYTVSVTSGGDTVTRTITVGEAVIQVSEIGREFGGVPLESIPYEENFTATVDAEGTVDSVEFNLGGVRQVDTDGTDGWNATVDLGTLNGTGELTVTAVDDQGNETTRRLTVPIQTIPDWMEWLLDGPAQVTVVEEETHIDISYNPFDLNAYSFLLGDVPIDTVAPEFDGAPDAHVGYDAGAGTAVLQGQGGIDSDLFGQEFDADLSVQGAINTDLALLRASGTAAGSIAIDVGPPMSVDPPDWVPCFDDEIGIEITVEPGLAFTANFDGDLQFQDGTASPSVTLTAIAQLNICTLSLGASVSGSLDVEFDVGTSDPNVRGTISATGTAWFRAGNFTARVSVDFQVDVGEANTQNVVSVDSETVSTELEPKRGSQPALSTSSTVVADQDATVEATGLEPTAASTDTVQRLTDRSLGDKQPSVETTGGDTVVVWSRQLGTKSVSDGRDIAFQRKTSTGWSAVELLTDDLRMDEAPVVAANDNGKLLVAWQRIDYDVTDSTDPATVQPHYEIAYTTYDGTAWASPTVLTDTSAREFNPTIAPDGTSWLLAWEAEVESTNERSVRYVTVASDGTTGTITDVAQAAYPATGSHSSTGAVLGFAPLSSGQPVGVRWNKIESGSVANSHEFSASGVSAVAVGEDRVVWQEGPVDDPRLVDGDVPAAQTTDLAIRPEVAAVAEPTLVSDGADAVLAYRAYVVSANTRELVYRIDRGGDWIFDRKFVQEPPDTTQDLSIWQLSCALPSSGTAFTTAFSVGETSETGKNDVFVASHDFRPDYAIRGSGPAGASAGDTVTLSYTVWNRGDVDGTQQLDVVVSNGTGELARDTVGPLSADATVSGSVDVTVDTTGEFALTLDTGSETTLDPPTETASDYEAGSTTVTAATPDLSVRRVETTASNEVTITVGNAGGAKAVDVPLVVSDGTSELVNTTLADVGIGEEVTTALTIDPTTIDRESPDRILLDPDDVLGGAVSENNRVTPTWLLRPTLELATDVSYELTLTNGLVARVLVGNLSPVTATGTVKAFTDGGTLAGETTMTVSSGSADDPVYETIEVPLDTSTVVAGADLELVVDSDVPTSDESKTVTVDGAGPFFVEPTALAQRWAYDADSSLQHSTPAVDTDRVYVGGLGSEFRALSRGTSDAQVEWSEARTGALSDSSPILSGGLVFVGSGGGTLYAFDPDASDSNRVAWTYEIDSAITSTPTVSSGTVYVGANDGTVHAVNTDGTVHWGSPVDAGGPVYSPLAAANGTVFVTTNDGSLVALDAASGTEQWRFETETELGASGPTVANGTVYVGADRVYALDASFGIETWAPFDYGGTAGSTPTYRNGTLYVGSADGHLYVLDSADGTEQWRYETDAGIAADPAVVDGTVLVTSLAGTVSLLDAATGMEFTTASLDSASRSSPVRDNLDVYLGSRSGSVVEFEIETQD